MARSFVWTPQKERALDMLLAGEHTQAQIAAELGVTRRTIEGWVRRRAWRMRYDAQLAAQLAAWDKARQARERAHVRAFYAELDATAPGTKYQRRSAPGA